MCYQFTAKGIYILTAQANEDFLAGTFIAEGTCGHWYAHKAHYASPRESVLNNHGDRYFTTNLKTLDRMKSEWPKSLVLARDYWIHISDARQNKTALYFDQIFGAPRTLVVGNASS